MNDLLRFRGSAFPLAPGQQRIFRLALTASIAFHAAGLLTSPLWRDSRPLIEEVVSVDIADIPASELPPVPKLSERDAERLAPPPASGAPAEPGPPPPPSKEAIREKVRSRGLLRIMERGPSGGSPPAPGPAIPDAPRYANRGAPGQGDYRATLPAGSQAVPRPSDPGIGGHVASASRSSTALSSSVFRTDAGLEGRMTGGLGGDGRSADAILSRIREYERGIRSIYNRELSTNPDISGIIMVSFVIRPDGTVESPEISRSSVNWPALEKAVLTRMRHWTFPSSKGGTVKVDFPFNFAPET